MVLDPAIEAFFSERKEAWLKKNIKASMTDEEHKEKTLECENVFALSTWLPNAAKRIASRSMTTHPSKFSHPSTGVGKKNKANGTFVTPLYFSGTFKADGYLRTGNVVTELMDSVGSAAELDVEDFLRLKMIDGKTILEHIESESEFSKNLLSLDGMDYVELKEGLLAIKPKKEESSTNSKIKQVYFLVQESYHQLSILTNSSLLFELRSRIESIFNSGKDVRNLKKDNKVSGIGFSDLYGITTIGYGGTKPANISVLNNQNAGKAHILMSAPPSLFPRNIHLPKEDFFLETLNPWHIKETFNAFHRIVKTDYKNANIREGRDYRIQEYVDYVVQKMWQLRAFIDNYEGELPTTLKAHQKIWLYPEHHDQRNNDDEWLDKVCTDLIRSFSKQGYQKVLGKEAIKLGDDAYLAVERIVDENKEALR